MLFSLSNEVQSMSERCTCSLCRSRLRMRMRLSPLAVVEQTNVVDASSLCERSSRCFLPPVGILILVAGTNAKITSVKYSVVCGN